MSRYRCFVGAATSSSEACSSHVDADSENGDGLRMACYQT